MHLFLHIDGVITASEMINKLTEIAGVLGFGDCEIFLNKERLMLNLGL